MQGQHHFSEQKQWKANVKVKETDQKRTQFFSVTFSTELTQEDIHMQKNEVKHCAQKFIENRSKS